ncbi:hypothetical protein G9A89_002402 [Geosiphon pyriformis]|nr:hypothetical protein G9A89_002402 [Geosiphon pyriformis]
MSTFQSCQYVSVCRICLSNDDPSDLIAPCICRGTVKYVHKTCLSQWRYRLVANGREEEFDSCTICKFKYVLKRKTTWGCILSSKGARMAITVALIIALLLPCGYLMKLSMLVTSPIYLKGTTGMMENATISMEQATPISASPETTPIHPFYPPICTSKPAIHDTKEHFLNINKHLKPNDAHFLKFPLQNSKESGEGHSNLLDSLYPSFISWWIFPPIMTAQFWFDFLCKPEIHHLHLGLFFLGSLNNVFTAYAMMSDVYDMITENPRRKLKQVVLVYTSLFVACFWFHYNISAFRVASTQEFLQELPFWVLRWITVSMAIVDFGLRRIYWELDRLEFDDAQVVSVQDIEHHSIIG